MNEPNPAAPYQSEVLRAINEADIPQPQLTGHLWRQEGTQIICQSCPFKHASFIEPGYQLYGIDDAGMPMIRRIQVNH